MGHTVGHTVGDALGDARGHAPAGLALGSLQDPEAAPRTNGTNGTGSPAMDASTKF